MSTSRSRSRHWQKIGVELEGGWSDDPREFLEYSHLVDVKSDSSVNFELSKFVGEVTVGPYDRYDRLVAAMTHCYPAATDRSCGFHVHVSFSPDDIRRLCTREFFTFFLDWWERWGKANKIKGEFWTRLRGQNYYCFRPNSPADVFNHYSMLNFSAYGYHGTLECRLLPMFKNKLIAHKAVKSLLECYETWLSNPDNERTTDEYALQLLSGDPGCSHTKAQERARKKLEEYKRAKGAPKLERCSCPRSGDGRCIWCSSLDPVCECCTEDDEEGEMPF